MRDELPRSSDSPTNTKLDRLILTIGTVALTAVNSESPALNAKQSVHLRESSRNKTCAASFPSDVFRATFDDRPLPLLQRRG